MQEHPFWLSKKRQFILLFLIVLGIAVQCALLTGYENAPLLPALADSFVSVISLGVVSFPLWYAIGSIRSFQTHIFLTLPVMGIWSVICYLGWYAALHIAAGNYPDFWFSYPLRLLFGLLIWIVTIQWYRLQKTENRKKELTADIIESIGKEELTDRIAVKDRGQIYIIRLDDLIYIQAAGDYVTLVTTAARYIKEQTMKYYETHLPALRFVRIHRSYLVNVEYIRQVTLYEKENYKVLLKNGDTLKVSASGYKLLKEQLDL